MIQFAPGIRVGDLPLDQLGSWSTLLLGLLATSLLSTFNELKKAIDTHDTAQVPPLLPSLSPRPRR